MAHITADARQLAPNPGAALVSALAPLPGGARGNCWKRGKIVVAKNDWRKLRHSCFKVVPLILFAGGIVLGIKYVIETYLAWHVPSFVYLVLMAIAMLIVRNNSRYTPLAKTSEEITEKNDDN